MSNCYPNGAPLPADAPPWGIHAIDPEEAHHGAALADGTARQECVITRIDPEWIKKMQSMGTNSKGNASSIFRDALNKAARVVEEEAILFDEEAFSLRRLATSIRSIKQ